MGLCWPPAEQELPAGQPAPKGLGPAPGGGAGVWRLFHRQRQREACADANNAKKELCKWCTRPPLLLTPCPAHDTAVDSTPLPQPMAIVRQSWKQKGSLFTEYGVTIRCVRLDQTASVSLYTHTHKIADD